MTRLLETANLPYMVVGAHAVMVHGEPRFSHDLDVVISLRPADRDRVREALEGTELTSWHWAEDPPWGRRFRCFDRDGILVELFLTGGSALHEREFERRVKRIVRGTPTWFLSPEDLVLRKLVNCRLRKSMDFDDAISVIRVQGAQLDHDYVRRHCAVHRVCGLFERAVQEAHRTPPGDASS